MDEHLQKVFDRMKQELNHIHYRWTLYRQVFGTNPSRIKLINRTSSSIFVEFQWLIIDYMVISLSKLTDRARMQGNNNLSFHYLIEKVRGNGNVELTDELNAELEVLTIACEKFREIRNKRVAHNDLVVALDEYDSPLPGVSRADIEKALFHARNLMNKVELHFNDSQTLYEEIIIPLENDGRSVLIWLQKGLMYEQLEDEGLIECGKWRELGDLDA
ncbi:AbiU2 domain-containing protein [Aeromonas sp. OTU364]|uniref:AbiU2 domain-containing protein n=1 Tax=Aeromonas sp. OTU364 TaxID=3043864 RepID=UPI00313D7F78